MDQKTDSGVYNDGLSTNSKDGECYLIDKSSDVLLRPRLHDFRGQLSDVWPRLALENQPTPLPTKLKQGKQLARLE